MAKYRIELTENQLSILRQAVEMMMRTGMGQSMSLTEWIITNGEHIKITSENIDWYCTARDYVNPVLRAITAIGNSYRDKSEKVLELETLYDAIKHQIWVDADIDHTSYSVDGHEPMKWGNEPIPKIEKVEE